LPGRLASSSRLSPHSLRHSFVTAALDAAASLRDVQDAAGHADPRTTRRYDRDRHSLDRHPTYAVAAHVAQ
jgi:integrase/recombinase XerD